MKQLDLFENAIPAPALRRDAPTAEILAFPTCRNYRRVRVLAEQLAPLSRDDREIDWRVYSDQLLRARLRAGLSKEQARADVAEFRDVVRTLTYFLEADGGWRSGQPSKRA